MFRNMFMWNYERILFVYVSENMLCDLMKYYNAISGCCFDKYANPIYADMFDTKSLISSTGNNFYYSNTNKAYLPTSITRSNIFKLPKQYIKQTSVS